MATTQLFYVSTQDNKVRPITQPFREYFGDKRNGFSKYLIEVFGEDTFKTANKVRDMVDKSGITTEILTIKIETL